MVKTDETGSVMFNERLKEITRRRHITETYTPKEIYNIYKNLLAQKDQFQKMADNIEKDRKELEPIFMQIKEEVEKEKKAEVEKSG